MRYMVIVKADGQSEAGALPSEQMLIDMGKFNQELIEAGIMLSGEGLLSSSQGFRMNFTGGKPRVTDGPFTESKELIAGFWIVKVKSKDEVIEWFRKCPAEVGELEFRQVAESEDFEEVITTPEGRAVLEAEDEFRKRGNN